MIRRFVTAQGDNNPVTSRLTITPTTSSGTQIITTGFPVSWAIVAGIGDSAAPPTKGPFYFDPDGSTTYSVSTISGGDVYIANSLKVYLNGQLLDNGIHFDEDVGGDNFTLNVGAGALDSAPNVDNTRGILTFTGQTSAFNLGATLTQGGTGVTATIAEISNDTGTTGQLSLTNISPGGDSFDTSAIVDDGGSPGGATAGVFSQGGDRMAISYRPTISLTFSGIEIYVSAIYPDRSTGLELTYSGASIGTPFSVDLVYN